MVVITLNKCIVLIILTILFFVLAHLYFQGIGTKLTSPCWLLHINHWGHVEHSQYTALVAHFYRSVQWIASRSSYMIIDVEMSSCMSLVSTIALVAVVNVRCGHWCNILLLLCLYLYDNMCTCVCVRYGKNVPRCGIEQRWRPQQARFHWYDVFEFFFYSKIKLLERNNTNKTLGNTHNGVEAR